MWDDVRATMHAASVLMRSWWIVQNDMYMAKRRQLSTFFSGTTGSSLKTSS